MSQAQAQASPAPAQAPLMAAKVTFGMSRSSWELRMRLLRSAMLRWTGMGPLGLVGGGRLQRIEDAGQQVRAHGVHGLGPLQRDGGDGVLDLVVDGAHGMWPYS